MKRDRDASTPSCCEERWLNHYTVAELSEAWNVSSDFIRDLFRDERDIVRWARSRPGKRRYIVIRIPASAAERVYRRAQERV